MDFLYWIVIISVTSICSAVSTSTNDTDLLTDSKNESSCCENGGICILGSFCICPKFFDGWLCPHKTKYRSCNYVPHGYWIRSDCNLCRCFDGRVACIPKYYFGCEDDDEPLDPTKPVDPFSGKIITTYATDPDVPQIPTPPAASSGNEFYYDDYYYSDTNAGSASCPQVSLILIICFLSIRFL
ncbi:cryptic protein-like isoform X2 [Ostrea edulis]|uniref:cryptic protein-like isoform X2 n=1 Tax=Ostrea edulis TaxID=37623 RepID=UPI0024AECF65|nr:cryptic protein-like isoform X2 [Ostrea edulis]